MLKYNDWLFMAMTDATGGATGGSDRNGADATDETEARPGGDNTTNSGDIPGVADGAVDPRAEQREAAGSDVATTVGNEPGNTLNGQQGDAPHPGYVSDRILETPGQIDEAEIGSERMGAGMQRDLGIDPDMREEMLDNARQWGLDEQPTNVNDERAFDDGLPGSISDFSVVSTDNPEGSARFADPNDDAGGEVSGPRVGGAGGIDGGPERKTPLPGEDDT